MSDALSTPQMVMQRLEELDRDMALRLPAYEAAALAWYRAKRDREHAEAVAFIGATGPVDQRKAIAREATSMIGKNEEAEFEAIRAVMRTIETRVGIGQSLLRAQGRS